MIDEATETIREAAEAMDAIGTIAAFALGGTLAQKSAALAEILALANPCKMPLGELAREMVALERNEVDSGPHQR